MEKRADTADISVLFLFAKTFICAIFHAFSISGCPSVCLSVHQTRRDPMSNLSGTCSSPTWPSPTSASVLSPCLSLSLRWTSIMQSSWSWLSNGQVVYQRWHWGDSYVLCHLHSPLQVNFNVIIILSWSSSSFHPHHPPHHNILILIIIIVTSSSSSW